MSDLERVTSTYRSNYESALAYVTKGHEAEPRHEAHARNLAKKMTLKEVGPGAWSRYSREAMASEPLT